MKKKVIALALSLVLAFGSATTAFAASPTTEDAGVPSQDQQNVQTSVVQTENPTSVSEGFKISESSEQTKKSAESAVKKELNNLTTLAQKLSPELQSKINEAVRNGGTVTAQILGTKDITPTTAQKGGDAFTQADGADGFYTIVLGNAGIKAGDDIFVLNYNEIASNWDVIQPFAVADGAIAYKAAAVSHVAIVKIVITNNSSDAPVPAPQTGETVPYAAMAMILVGVAGAAVAGRKFTER